MMRVKRNNVNNFNRYLSMLIFTVFIATAMIICIPFVDFDSFGLEKIGAYVVSAVLWICLVAQIVLIVKCSKERAQLEKARDGRNRLKNAGSGIFSFASNPEGFVADIAFVLSIVMIVILIIINRELEWLTVICIAVFYFSFSMHCILNGKNYRYAKTLKFFEKERKDNEDD